VFNFRKEGALLDIVDGGEEGTIITNG